MDFNDHEHQVSKDAKGKIRQISHPQTPYVVPTKTADDAPRDVAAKYIE